jgi:Cu(I)/Ag(I) efflux system membrane fusion protein
LFRKRTKKDTASIPGAANKFKSQKAFVTVRLDRVKKIIMKKNILYIAIALIIGLLGGYFLFGNSSEGAIQMSLSHEHSEESTNPQMWTCSMHPQIMQPEPGDCPICGMDLIRAESSGEGLAANEIKMTKNAMALANIQTTIVGSDASSNSSLQLSGKIKINEDQTATLPAHFDGRVEELYVKTLGEKVNRGQKVATVYAPALVAAQQELITTARLKDSQPELYKAVRAKFKNWKIHGDILDQMETTGNIVKEFPIYSHVSGVVTEIVINEGAHIMDGAPILKVSDLSSVWAEFDAFENQISQFKRGQKIKISSSAYANKEFDATISFIDPILNNATRTVNVRATLDNREDLFKPGMFVTGKIQESTQTTSSETVTIPASAVLWTGERSLVYIKTHPNEPVFEMREITLANRSGEHYQVSSGLKDGDEIVTQGTFTVDAAAQLQGKKSMMNSGLSSKKALPIAIQQVLKSSISPYLEMKNAFVLSDGVEVSAFAKATLNAMKVRSNTDLSSDLQSLLKSSENLLSSIATTTDLETQRSYFIDFNAGFIALIHQIENLDKLLYVQQCPMVSNNTGAIWLSADASVKNPYYGDAMLTCGSVIEELE